jgi:carbon-monoxide dehydrogenase large subunit
MSARDLRLGGRHGQGHRQVALWCTTQAPHAHRSLYAIVAGLPEHKIQVIAPDIGGGFGNKVPIYPGYVCSIVGSIVTGKPVKWMEGPHGEPDVHGLRPRLPDDGRIAADRDGPDAGRCASTVLA